MSFSPVERANSAPTNLLDVFKGHCEAGKERGKERKERERERKERDEGREKTHRNKFPMRALNLLMGASWLEYEWTCRSVAAGRVLTILKNN